MKKILYCIVLSVLVSFSYAQEKLNVFDIARKGTVAELKVILSLNNAALNTVNEDGFSPLVLACYRGNNEVAKYLIDLGCDLNSNSKMGTPLMACVVKGNNEIAKLLIDKKADVNSFDSNGTSALIYAVIFNNEAILKLLLNNNADKTHKDNDGKTAFEHAVFAGKEKIINLLK